MNAHSTWAFSFSIPGIKTSSSSEEQRHQLCGASLGIRRQPIIVPRPLHDPMEDHAIVLYDPTIDDKPEALDDETEAAAKAATELEARNAGPHKSLKQILGLDQVKKKEAAKVPVVIDPR